MTLQVDILYTKDCSDWQTLAEMATQALEELGLEAEFQTWLVETDKQAIEWGFSGSPSIFVNGQDLFPIDDPNGLALRSYETEEGLLPYPSYGQLIAALQMAVGA